jgi:D-arabinose 1-dehydrogenase-like Zn-dependent alcohol dehydrogenase
VGSHEPAGRVVDLGPDAEKEGKIKIGDRVGSTNVSSDYWLPLPY